MKIVVIGGTGHIGTYLVPLLVKMGHDVICVSRNNRKPYNESSLWKLVQQLTIDRTESERQGTFGAQIRALKSDIIVDLICFTPESATLLAESLIGNIHHFLHCGTMWVYGQNIQFPTHENQERRPIQDYGINKATIESYLLSLYRSKKFPVTIIHPGHITGPGWLPINPVGNLNPEIFIKLAKNEEIVLPNMGMETLHHVHAADVAQGFVNAIENRQNAIGESFNIVSNRAVTLKEYANEMAKWFGQDANISFLPWDKWKETVTESDAELTWKHIAHSTNGSMLKANKLLNYKPHYSSIQAIQESIKHYFKSENFQMKAN